MVSALVNGVKGGKWFSLVDKAIRPATLAVAWLRVARNNGAAGVDGQSIERFAAQADRYLRELHDNLKDGSYRPSPVKRVEIPKGDGRTRPLGIPTVKSLPRRRPGGGPGPDRADGSQDGHRADL
jgi:RNA-directed DNA polymerase